MVGVAAACSVLAIGSVLFVLPTLYQEINDIHTLVSFSTKCFLRKRQLIDISKPMLLTLTPMLQHRPTTPCDKVDSCS